MPNMAYVMERGDRLDEEPRYSGKEVVGEDETGGEKTQFYVQFLGWMESDGVRGARYVQQALQQLTQTEGHSSPPKVTLQLTAREVRINQELEGPSYQHHINHHHQQQQAGSHTVSFPPIATRDVTYVVQAQRPVDRALDDVVACIYLGYMPRTRRYVHVHVYRFDEPSTAATFTRLLGDIVDSNQNRIREIERDLVARREIEDPGPDGWWEDTAERRQKLSMATDSAAGSLWGSGHSEETWSPADDEDVQHQKQEEGEEVVHSLKELLPFDSLASELKQRLVMGEAPLLLPPTDYDTISRARGNRMGINERRRLNKSLMEDEEAGNSTVEVVGTTGEQHWKHRDGSESGVDLPSPCHSHSDDVSHTNLPDQHISGYSFPVAPLSPRVLTATEESSRVYYQSHGHWSGEYPSSPISPSVEESSIYPPRKDKQDWYSAPPTPKSDNSNGPVYPTQSTLSGGYASPRSSADFENGSIYPPRQHSRVGGGSASSPVFLLRRQTSHSSMYSATSSHSSRHSEGDWGTNHDSRLSGSIGSGPLLELVEDVPPRDYDDDDEEEEDPFPPHHQANTMPLSNSLGHAAGGPHQTVGVRFSSPPPMRRNWSTSALQTNMAPGSERGGLREVDEDRYHIQRVVRPGNHGQGQAGIAFAKPGPRGGMRRVNSGPSF